MQPVLSFSSPFVLFHVHREKTKHQKVTLGIAAMFNCFLRPLECPYQLSSSFKTASSSFFCYFTYSTNFLSGIVPSQAFALLPSSLLTPMPETHGTSQVQLLQGWIRSLQTCVPIISFILSSSSISLKSLLKVFPPPLQSLSNVTFVKIPKFPHHLGCVLSVSF